jgi:hypothetical protein
MGCMRPNLAATGRFGWKADIGSYSRLTMKRRSFAPDPFAMGMFLFGLLLLILPAMRVAGLVALVCDVLYWLVMGLLKASRR